MPFLLVLLLLVPTFLTAQQDINGTVLDASDGRPLTGATIKLVNMKDTTVVKGAFSDKKGAFTIADVQRGSWKATASFIGYRPKSSVVFVKEDDVRITLRLDADTVLSRDVVVEANAIRVEMKGDTLDYNAQAFKVNKSATAEDLVQKMPGVTIENGVVKAQGEEVRKILVDGREFFGDDASATLRNLPAEMVDRVQVFDRMNDQSMFAGFDDGNTQRTMNVVTKQDRRNGVFGRAYAGYGTEERYQAGTTLNDFHGAQRTTLLAQSNNINQQNFSFSDIMNATGSGGGPMGRMGASFMQRMGGNSGFSRWVGQRGGPRGPGGDAGNFFVSSQDGITTTHAIGLNYSDILSQHVAITGSYFFNYGDNLRDTRLTRDYATDSSSQLYDEVNDVNGINRSHRVNMRIEWALDTANAFLFTPRLNVQPTTNTTKLVGTTTDPDTLSRTLSTNTANGVAAVLAGTVTFRHKFETPNRNLTISAGVDATTRDQESSLRSIYQFADVPDTVGVPGLTGLDQQTELNTASRTLNGNIAWTEPVGTSLLLQASYAPSFALNESDKTTNSYDSTTSAYTRLDSALSSNLDNTYDTHRGTALARWQEGNTIVTAGGTLQFASLGGTQVFPTTYDIQREFTNILPQFMWQQRFSQQSNLRLQYRTSTNAPSVTQLQNVYDLSTPLQPSRGNSDLVQDYTHNVSIRFSDVNWMMGRSTFFFINASTTMDYIGTATVFSTRDTVLEDGTRLPPGAQLTYPVNLDGQFSLRAFGTWGVPANFIGSNLNLNGGFNVAATPGLINGAKNTATSTSASMGFFLGTSNSEALDVSVSYNGAYTWVRNTIRPEQDANYFTQFATARVVWRFGPVACSTDVSNTLYSGLGEGYDQVFTVWNAGIGYRFLDDAAELRMSVFDILGQNTNISRSVTETYVEDSRSNALTRYGMLTFTYDLRKFGG